MADYTDIQCTRHNLSSKTSEYDIQITNSNTYKICSVGMFCM